MNLARIDATKLELYKEYLLAKDELKMTLKSDRAHRAKAQALKKAEGRLSHCHKAWNQHVREHRCLPFSN
jgi:hypothetical protein